MRTGLYRTPGPLRFLLSTGSVVGVCCQRSTPELLPVMRTRASPAPWGSLITEIDSSSLLLTFYVSSYMVRFLGKSSYKKLKNRNNILLAEKFLFFRSRIVTPIYHILLPFAYVSKWCIWIITSVNKDDSGNLNKIVAITAGYSWL